MFSLIPPDVPNRAIKIEYKVGEQVDYFTYWGCEACITGAAPQVTY